MSNYVLRVVMNYVMAFLLLAAVLCWPAAADMVPDSLIMSSDELAAAPEVTDIDYVSDPTDARVLSTVTFRVLPAPAADAELAVRVQPDGRWYRCSLDDSSAVCPTVSERVTLREVVDVRVVVT